MADSRAFGYGGGDNSDQRQQPGRRIYDPYKDLQIPYRAIYDLPTSPEFLFQEESVAQRRSWGENLTYYTGIGYLGGAVGAAAVGLYEGLLSAEPGETLKLRVNRVLNSSGQQGRRFGNMLGVVGLLYAGSESGLAAVRGSDDWINGVAAGLGTRAANGPRSAAIAAAIGGLMVGAAIAGKQVLKRYAPI